jgi:hypothetical protein
LLPLRGHGWQFKSVEPNEHQLVTAEQVFQEAAAQK